MGDKTVLVLASNNLGKLGELQELFAPLGVTLVAKSTLNVPEAPEPHRTFIENALEKARNACKHTGLPAIADDAGLCVVCVEDRANALLRPCNHLCICFIICNNINFCLTSK